MNRLLAGFFVPEIFVFVPLCRFEYSGAGLAKGLVMDAQAITEVILHLW